MITEKNGYNISLVVYATELDLDALRYFIPLTMETKNLSVSGDTSHALINCVTTVPWKVMEYCSTIGEMEDIRIERVRTA